MKPVTDYPPGSIVCVYAPGSVYVGHFVIVSLSKMLDIDTGKVISTMRNRTSVHFSTWDGYCGSVRETLDAKEQMTAVKKVFKRIMKE